MGNRNESELLDFFSPPFAVNTLLKYCFSTDISIYVAVRSYERVLFFFVCFFVFNLELIVKPI